MKSLEAVIILFVMVVYSDPDTKPIAADLAAEMIRIMRELTGAEAAKLATVRDADITHVRNAYQGRFTIDQVVNVPNHVDGEGDSGFQRAVKSTGRA